MSDLVLRLQNVVKSYPGSQETILSIRDLELRRGQHLAIRGKSGSGKSTLLNLVAGILVPDSGRVEVAGQDLGRLSESQRDSWRGKNLGYVHQTFHLLPALTVYENLWLACALSGGKTDRIEHFIQRLDLQKRRHHRPAQLSVGQQQRVAVARALVHQPQLVLADEPTGNLDAELAQVALQLLRSVCMENQAALLVVSHDSAILGRFEQCLDLSVVSQPC